MITNFNSYRSYLRDYLKKLPLQGHGEASKIAKYLEVSSTFISQVLSGDKMLTPEQGERLSEYLGHAKLEAEYFFFLVQHERAGTQRLKKYCAQKLNEIKEEASKLVHRVQPKRVLSEEEKSIFYSSPLYSALHLYTSTNEKGRTLDDIATRFEISRAKATSVLEFLLHAGLVSESKGYFKMSTQSTHVERTSPHLQKHLSNWRIRAIQRGEELTEDELMYTANVSLSEKDFRRLREDMVGFIKTFLDGVHASPAEEIACFNLDFFWIK